MTPQEKKYENYTLYAFDEKFFPILEKILRKECEMEILKNDYKSYVVKVKLDDKSYILKKILCRKKRKKYMTFFRKGDCFKTFLNVKEAQEKGCTELADIYGVGVYKKGIIQDQFMLMEYGIGRPINRETDSPIVETFLKKLHLTKRCHGDPHPDNFLMDKDNNVIVIDTRLKKICLGDYQAHRDMILFRRKFRVKTEYPYKKSIFYYYCIYKKKITGRL